MTEGSTTREGIEGAENGLQGVCWWTQFFDDACEGRMDRCHIGFDKQTLRLKGLDPADERVWRWGCRHHHERSHWHTFKLRRDQLPASVEDFAQEHELVHRLDRDYGAAA